MKHLSAPRMLRLVVGKTKFLYTQKIGENVAVGVIHDDELQEGKSYKEFWITIFVHTTDEGVKLWRERCDTFYSLAHAQVHIIDVIRELKVEPHDKLIE